MKKVGEFYNYILGIQDQMDGLTFFLFDSFYSRMVREHGPELSLEEIRKKILKEMLILADNEYTNEIQKEYESKSLDLEEIRIFLRLTKSIFKK